MRAMTRRWRAGSGAAFLASLLAWMSPAASQNGPGGEQLLIVGTAPVAGVYYPAGGAICRLVNEDRSSQGLRCLVESTSGSAENLKRLRSGDLDFVLLQSDWQYHAFQGSGGPGVEQPFVDLRAVFSLHAQPLTVVVARESGIAKLNDLLDNRVSLGPRGSASRSAAESLIESFGWDRKTAFSEIVELGIEEQVQALCSGRIDAFILPTSHPNGLIAAATEGCLADLVPVDGPAIDRVLEEKPYHSRAAIPGQLYRGLADAIPSFGVRATLVTRADMSPEAVYFLVKSVFERLDEMRGQHPALGSLDPERMVEASLTAPLHEGAMLFYKEQGLR